ncbi:MAG TPA: DNA polymerase III subunit delta' [Intrasporangiaceae bacterium]|nr:DNA polymerase III subunit delta' [Intrasporangiaceae bacterium]
MSVWDDIVGQGPAIEVLQRAIDDPEAMTHAWLFTGPPGSGRSNAARAFAAALQCPQGGCGTCRECRTSLDGTHADVTVVATQHVQLRVEETRGLVQESARRPSLGRWRIIIVEDADRMNDTASNALLKAIEEPTARTVWLLCAPSPDDLLTTIRSRTRNVRLRTPPAAEVAALLQRRDGIDQQMALYAARAAQSHIGMARRLARDESARKRRRDVITLAAQIHTVGDAVNAAEVMNTIADEEEVAQSAERHAAERARLLETLGADPAARTQPPHIRSQIKALEEDQKARTRRAKRDVIDRVLTDLLSVYRDALIASAQAPVDLVNPDHAGVVDQVRSKMSPEQILHAMDAIGLARERIEGNVPPLLALEAMAISLRLPR